MPHILQARNLRMTFYDANRADMLALDDLSLAVEEGEFLAIVGPSGCGKSTLLRLLAGLLHPISGTVEFRGEPLLEPSHDIGYVFQRANLMPWRTVAANIALPLEVAHAPASQIAERTEALIALVGLEGFADSHPAQLSGGMQQRVALARALIHEPTVLLLDEPFGSLDALTRERMNAELLRIWNVHRRTVVMVTHSISEAVLLSDRILVLTPRPGRLRTEFAVPLARPRAPALTGDPAFVQLTRAVRAEIVD
jgi:NitT/TauT family transport system ATP-binding protein